MFLYQTAGTGFVQQVKEIWKTNKNKSKQNKLHIDDLNLKKLGLFFSLEPVFVSDG